jgi:hypothetical protein
MCTYRRRPASWRGPTGLLPADPVRAGQRAAAGAGVWGLLVSTTRPHHRNRNRNRNRNGRRARRRSAKLWAVHGAGRGGHKAGLACICRLLPRVVNIFGNRGVQVQVYNHTKTNLCLRALDWWVGSRPGNGP